MISPVCMPSTGFGCQDGLHLVHAVPGEVWGEGEADFQLEPRVVDLGHFRSVVPSKAVHGFTGAVLQGLHRADCNAACIPDLQPHHLQT